jgi:acetaldehyde dehydrogenase (acetylating)
MSLLTVSQGLTKDLASVQEVHTLMANAKVAQQQLQALDQTSIDRIVSAMATAGYAAREELATLAIEETGFGNWEDKVTKNIVSTQHLYNHIKDLKTCGIIAKKQAGTVWEVASPMGIVAGFVPSTNPTSTMMYKAIIALKSRNALVASPHPRSARCTIAAAQIMQQAAEAAGAPANSIQCLSLPTREGKSTLMCHPATDVILATGNTALVQAAHASGKPAYGVGAGNVPAFIEATAQVAKAVADIFFGKTFDYGTLCSSEQAIVCDRSIASPVRQECQQQGGYFLNPLEVQQLTAFMFPDGKKLNPQVVGCSALKLAAMAGLSVPIDTRVLMAELTGVGHSQPLSGEKLSPVLAFYVVDGWAAGLDKCVEILEFGGMGHSAALHSQDEQVIEAFVLRQPAHRILINTVAAVGAVGYTTALAPGFSLGAGTIGGSITTDNIGPLNLLNVKRIGFEVKPLHDGEGDRI